MVDFDLLINICLFFDLIDILILILLFIELVKECFWLCFILVGEDFKNVLNLLCFIVIVYEMGFYEFGFK